MLEVLVSSTTMNINDINNIQWELKGSVLKFLIPYFIKIDWRTIKGIGKKTFDSEKKDQFSLIASLEVNAQSMMPN